MWELEFVREYSVLCGRSMYILPPPCSTKTIFELAGHHILFIFNGARTQPHAFKNSGRAIKKRENKKNENIKANPNSLMSFHHFNLNV